MVSTARSLNIQPVERNLKELVASERNARVMSARTMQRLEDNLRRDGVLSSAPLVYGDRIISGHHRVEAAIRAGIASAVCLQIQGEVPEEHLTALQLSHNSLVGEDDPHKLAEMLSALPPFEQDFAAIDLPPVDLPALGPSISVPAATRIMLEFLPAEAEEVEACLQRIERTPSAQVEPSGLLAEFLEVFFAVKRDASATGMLSTPGTFAHMARLAREALGARVEQDGTAPASQAGEAGSTPATRSTGSPSQISSSPTDTPSVS